MKTNRRKFLINGLLASIGALFIPTALRENDIKAGSAYTLNYKPNPDEWKNSEINISWIGHSTILINFYGKWIITDPVLFERVGVYLMGTSIGPTRLTPPALTIDEIPKPDIVLLSHAHMDHCDYPTLKSISKKYPGQIDIITAYLTKDVFEDLPWKSITVLDWEEEAVVNNIHFKALEVKHFGWRFPWEKDRSRGFIKDGRSYNAYLINYNNKKILFGGDTADTDKLNRIQNENVDIALMPIGAYNPWKRAHCNPEEALRMADDINAKFFIPMHCKTFQQGQEPFNEPTNWLKTSVVNYKVKLGLEEIGQTFTI